MKCRPCHILNLSACLLASWLCASCGQERKLAELSKGGISAQLNLPASDALPQLDTIREQSVRDTLRVTGLDGREVLIMRAIRDDETGDMVATEELCAAVVQARFRNVAERNGRIDLEFQVTVPAAMRDSRWQLRLHPDMFVLGDSLRLDDVVITGEAFRKLQLKGYEKYGRYADSIIDDSTKFISQRALRIFIERNAEEFGDDAGEAADHYTNHVASGINELRRSQLGEKWRKYVRIPIVTEGIRLDTVLVNPDGNFEYLYVQTVNTRPGLRKIDVRMSGELFEAERRIYSMPCSDALTFYVSSLSSFADLSEKYRTVIVQRTVSANTTEVLDFERGSGEIDENYGDNASGLSRVKETLHGLLCSDAFVMDSIVISAFASPEGPVERNSRLAWQRAGSAARLMRSYSDAVLDSLKREEGLFVDVTDYMEEGKMKRGEHARIDFLSRSGGENWALLDEMVEADSLLTHADKERYRKSAGAGNPDERERLLQKEAFYPRLRDGLYPALRTVRFDFHLHRSGMVKDTVHTSVIDTLYMEGVRALRDHDYELALDRLASYQDYNTAVAMVALDRNRSALAILDSCPPTAQVNYMLALVHSRLGDERAAVERYIRACDQEPSYVHRGNLDPEIAALIRKYGLNTEEQ